MTSNSSILDQTKEFVANTLSSELDATYSYHNITHTEYVVEAAQQVAAQSNLNDDEVEIVLLAAWLHDIGYVKGHENHEDAGIEIASKFLDSAGVSGDIIEKVSGCIDASKMPQSPKNLMEQVLCDADLYHLSGKDYVEKCTKLRDEWTKTGQKNLTDEEWHSLNVQFLKEHTYFTNYGKTVLEKRKQKNLKQLKKGIKETGYDPKYVDKLESEVVKLKNRLAQAKIMKPDRGIETMFRTTSKNHLQLSAMADNKANIMISINSILLSVVVTILMRKLENNPHLIIPTFTLTFVCLVTIVIAILATRPNVTSGKFTRDDIVNKRTNLLFFGNFHGVPLQDYEWGMKEMMKDAEYLYSSLTRDIYFLGIVLGRKYKLLRLCYTVFMFGLVISVLLFVVSVLFFAHPDGTTTETLF